MEDLVNIAADLNINIVQNNVQTLKSDKLKPRENLFTHQSAALSRYDESNTMSKVCFYCDKGDHQIINCPEFKALDMDARWKAMRQRGLCRTCLIPHRKWPCRSKRECGVDGCRIRHHQLLHSIRSSALLETQGQRNSVHHNHHHITSFSLFRYLPVTLYGNGTQVNIFAFLDDGSSATLLEEKVAKRLGITGETDTLFLKWTGKITRHERTSQRINLKISGDNKSNKYFLENVRTVNELGLPRQTLNYSKLTQSFPHLKGLPMASYDDASPNMIIGLEHVHLLNALKTREGNCGDPIAVKTRLGWCVFGKNTGTRNSVEELQVHGHDDVTNNELHDSMRKFFTVEEAMVTIPLESEWDKKALSILK